MYCVKESVDTHLLHLISPHHITPVSHIKVTRIKKVITN